MTPSHSLPEALLDPAAWPESVAHVEFVATHSGWVFLGRDTAYKVKQPVRFAFLDFSTLEKREQALREELRLNAELAPGVYRRLVPITRRGEGLAFDGDGEFVDWALEMRRLPKTEMFTERLSAGTLEPQHLGDLGRRLAQFHEKPLDAALAAQHAGMSAVRALFVGNGEELATEFELSGDEAATGLARSYATDIGRILDAQAERFEQRLAAGRVRDGHGDLHLGNICLVDGEPVVYDRLEFQPGFRIQDVAADVAFLVMDLRVHGRTDLATAFLDAYVEASGDAGLPSVLEPHVAHRAAVRSKVEAIRHRLGHDRDAAVEARHYLLRAHAGVRERPVALMLGGLSGTGKSHLAKALCRDTGWEWIRTDLIRKQLFGLDPTERLDARGQAELYAPGVTERVYAEALEHARAAWSAGRSLLLDGTYLKRSRRDEVVAAAQEHRAEARIVWLECPDAVVRKRLEERSRRNDDPSDADVAVYEHQKASQEIPTDDEPAVRVDSRWEASRQCVEALAPR